MPLLEIRNLHVSVEDKDILKGIDFKVNKGEVHVIMGPNGAGKSTLVNAIMNNPAFEVTKGQIFYKDEDISELPAEERARKGIFMSFQNPEEVPGITVAEFLKAALYAKTGENIPTLKFHKQLEEAMKELKIDTQYKDRYLNVGFSGGEKKKSEILQLNVLKPQLAMLDETDSGLDVDAVKIVSEGISKFKNSENAIILITHHQELLKSIDIDKVHVIADGKIVAEGGPELAKKVHEEGYDAILEELSIKSDK